MLHKFRTENDTLGEVQVPIDALWGAQTQRSLHNFKIGNEKMPLELIHSLAIVKKAAAKANFECGVISSEKTKAIETGCEAIINGQLDNCFPLSLWQTGSGTQTNMNLNEVIANYAQTQETPITLSPNDDVNKSQSTNDVFPTAMRISAVNAVNNKLLISLNALTTTFFLKTEEFATIKKIGRTHLMDATPLTLGDEFSAFGSQLKFGIENIICAVKPLTHLPIGGTAVGNGINAPKTYDQKAVNFINDYTKLTFWVAENKFEAMASHDAFVELSGALKRVAVSLMKIANDIRLLASGPRCGFGELNLPENEPGSSIMPGKVNPTQCEALTMVCCQVIGNDVAITTGALQGHLQLNVFMPLIIRNILHSITILSDAINSFNNNCVVGIKPNLKNINTHLQNSLMLATALNPIIGYSNAAKIAQFAHQNDLTLKEAAITLQLISEEEFDKIMNCEL